MPLPSTGELWRERYRVNAILGEGGACRVYLATDLQDGSTVVLKVLRPQYLDSPTNWAAFLCDTLGRERLICDLIPQVCDYGFAPLPYSVSRLIPGETLFTHGERALRDDALVAFLDKASALLAALVSAGLQPWDINPLNWVFERFDAPSFVDFGDAAMAPALDPFAVSQRAPGPISDLLARLGGLVYFIAARRDAFGEWRSFYASTAGHVPPPLPLTHWRPDLPRTSERLVELLAGRPISTQIVSVRLLEPTGATHDAERVQRARLSNADDLCLLLPIGEVAVGHFMHLKRFCAIPKHDPTEDPSARLERWIEMHQLTDAPITIALLSPEAHDASLRRRLEAAATAFSALTLIA